MSPPSRTAIEGAVGSPNEKSGMKPAVEVALLAPSGRGDAFDGSLPETFGMLGNPFLQVVGHEGGDRRGAPGEKPQEEADPRRADHCPHALFDVGPGRHPAADVEVG